MTEQEHNLYSKCAKSILKFMYNGGLNVKPYPVIKLNDDPQEGLFIRTGYYEPSSKTVVVFTNGRAVKDCLRSMAHEFIHHSQNLDGKDLNFTSMDDVKDNERLEEIEGEAYLQGNIFFRKWTEYENSKKSSLNESKEYNIIENTNPDDIDLSSFNIKKDLNPKFWKDERLDSRIRMRLLDIADDFIEFLGIDWVKPEDIIITGSLANFNWHKKYSDIDLHILVDYSKVDKRKDFVKQYFYSQKQLWNEEHKDLKIMGFPVEVYVQDVNEKHSSTGVYSLEKDKWITEPERDKLAHSKVNKTYIKEKVAEYIDKIDKLYTIYKEADGDEYKIRQVQSKSDRLFDDIKNERSKGLMGDSNEISNGNIIFKCLRRMGYIEKIWDLKGKSYDKINSLP